MRRLLVFLFLIASPAFGSRDFVSASSQYVLVNTTVGNWEYTQAYTVGGWFRASSNNAGDIISKESSTAGWSVLARGGTSYPELGFTFTSNGGTNAVNVHTTADEFPLNTWVPFLLTYTGSGTAAGVTIYISGSSQTITTVGDNYTGSILNTAALNIASQRAPSTPALYLNGYLRRIVLYNRVLNSTEIANFFNDATNPDDVSGLQLWYEFGPLNDGSTMVADWSGNSNWGAITGATYSATDPTLTNRTPDLGTTGIKTLSGPLTKTSTDSNLPSSPGWWLANPSWVAQGSATHTDQSGPPYLYTYGLGGVKYNVWLSGSAGAKSFSDCNQSNTFDYDVPTWYYSTTNGTGPQTTFNVDNSATAILTCDNIGANSTFKTASHGETNISSVLYDPVNATWLGYFHSGASGGRQIYLATNSVDPTTANWIIYSNSPIIAKGSQPGIDDNAVSDFAVYRADATHLYGIYKCGPNGTTFYICAALSTDGGYTWTPYASNPVLNIGATGAWDAVAVFPPTKLTWDAPTGCFVIWFGGQNSTGRYGIGMAYRCNANPEGAFTESVYNPVLTSKYAGNGGNNNLEYDIAGTVDNWLDSDGYYHGTYQADNGNFGMNDVFGGRQAFEIKQIVIGSSGRLATLGVGH